LRNIYTFSTFLSTSLSLHFCAFCAFCSIFMAQFPPKTSLKLHFLDILRILHYIYDPIFPKYKGKFASFCIFLHIFHKFKFAFLRNLHDIYNSISAQTPNFSDVKKRQETRIRARDRRPGPPKPQYPHHTSLGGRRHL